MIIYIVEETDIHKPIACKELQYSIIPRQGEMIIVNGNPYQVSAVYHNLDIQEIKLVVKKV